MDPLDLISSFVRLLALLAWVLISAPLFVVLSPLRLLHRPMRWIGLSSYLPMDVMQSSWAHVTLWLVGVSVEVHGLSALKERLPPERGCIFLFK
jgi:hypothetical protein